MSATCLVLSLLIGAVGAGAQTKNSARAQKAEKAYQVAIRQNTIKSLGLFVRHYWFSPRAKEASGKLYDLLEKKYPSRKYALSLSRAAFLSEHVQRGASGAALVIAIVPRDDGHSPLLRFQEVAGGKYEVAEVAVSYFAGGRWYSMASGDEELAEPLKLKPFGFDTHSVSILSPTSAAVEKIVVEFGSGGSFASERVELTTDYADRSKAP